MSSLGNKRSPAKTIALVGIAAATVECAKLALAFLPNVEVVTLLIALYGYSFGFLGVAAALVFVCIEPLIWGFGTWVILYFVYWPFVAIVFMLLRRAGVKKRWILTSVAVVLTLLFGILSALIDVGLLSGFFDNFGYRFILYYARGIVFYLIQITCNAVLFFLLFNLLADKLESLKRAI